MNIDLITFISKNSAQYAEFLKFNCEHFKSKKNKIIYKCIESVDAERLPKGFKCVAKTGNAYHNSMNHALALNEAYKYIESDYVIYIDADTCITYKNWDQVIINELNNYDCFGTSYNEKIKYKNFPSVYLFAFRKHILEKVKLDFSPLVFKSSEKIKKIKLNKDEAKYFGMNGGDVLKCDTGWKLPKLILPHGYTSNVMYPVLMTSKKSLLPFYNEQHKSICMKHPTHHCEWHYDGKLFITHKQASRNFPINSDEGKAWTKRIKLYLKQIKSN